MKLFIVSDVLTDYTSGMVVVRAASVEQARDICKAQWTHRHGEFGDLDKYTEIAAEGGPGVVDYIYGGG